MEIKNYTRNETPQQARPHRIFKIGEVSMEPVRKPSNPLVYEFVGDSVVAIPAMNITRPTDSTYYHGTFKPNPNAGENNDAPKKEKPSFEMDMIDLSPRKPNTETKDEAEKFFEDKKSESLEDHSQ